MDGEADSPRAGPLRVMAWQRMHQQLHRHCGGWEDWPADQDLPVIEGTLIRLAAVTRAPGCPALEPMWLWCSVPEAGEAMVAVLWQACLRRFDLEHTFRFLKSQLGWTRPMLRDPAAADRWTWLLIACYDQLHLARPLAADLRLPWQRPQPPAAMTPAPVRAGFRCVRQALGSPAGPAKPGRPGPGRPPGSKNKHKARHQPVGKRTVKYPGRQTNRKQERDTG